MAGSVRLPVRWDQVAALLQLPGILVAPPGAAYYNSRPSSWTDSFSTPALSPPPISSTLTGLLKMTSNGKPAKPAVPVKTPEDPLSAPKAPAPKPAVKATAPQGKELLKKKTTSTEAKSTSVRRSPAKAEPVKPAPAAAKPVSVPISDEPQEGEIKHSVFVKIAKQKLLDLKDSLMDSMTGTASETLRNKAEGSEASAFGMHQADAGTDAYDRDFALSLLSQEQDALYEIEEALKRVTAGTYGICEMSNKRIPQARLEALPFARFTIECQQQYEKEVGPNSGRRQVRSLFGLMGSEDEDEDGDEESVESEKE